MRSNEKSKHMVVGDEAQEKNGEKLNIISDQNLEWLEHRVRMGWLMTPSATMVDSFCALNFIFHVQNAGIIIFTP